MTAVWSWVGWRREMRWRCLRRTRISALIAISLLLEVIRPRQIIHPPHKHRNESPDTALSMGREEMYLFDLHQEKRRRQIRRIRRHRRLQNVDTNADAEGDGREDDHQEAVLDVAADSLDVSEFSFTKQPDLYEAQGVEAW